MITLELPLELATREHGIDIYRHAGNKFLAFTHTNEGHDKVISSPNNERLFEAINLSPSIVVCTLLGGDIAIYLIDEKQWLTDAGETSPLFTSVEHTETHLEVQTPSSRGGCFVYCLRTKQWVSVPNWDLSMSFPVNEFLGVKAKEYLGRPCLILRTSNDKNPYSVFFTDDATYLSVPSPTGKEHECSVFHLLFPTYAVIGIGSGFGSTSKYFMIWNIAKKEYVRFTWPNRKPNKEEDAQFIAPLFTEKHIAVMDKWSSPLEPRYQILATDTWKIKHDILFTYERKTYEVDGAEIDSDGNLTVSVNGPKKILTTL